MPPDDSDTEVQQRIDGSAVTLPNCKPVHHPDRTCQNPVERVITVYYGGPAMTTIEWQVCEDHAGEVRETGEVREDREYRETEDGFAG